MGGREFELITNVLALSGDLAVARVHSGFLRGHLGRSRGMRNSCPCCLVCILILFSLVMIDEKARQKGIESAGHVAFTVRKRERGLHDARFSFSIYTVQDSSQGRLPSRIISRRTILHR